MGFCLQIEPEWLYELAPHFYEFGTVCVCMCVPRCGCVCVHYVCSVYVYMYVCRYMLGVAYLLASVYVYAHV